MCHDVNGQGEINTKDLEGDRMSQLSMLVWPLPLAPITMTPTCSRATQ
jgi:hypothetical protein